MAQRRSGIGSGLSWNFVATVLILGANTLTGALLARGFVPTDRGQIALILLWPNIISALTEIGLKDALTYLRASGELDDGVSLGTGLALGMLQALAAVLVSIVVVLIILPSHGHAVVVAGFVYLLFIPGHFVNTVIFAVANGQSRYSLVAWLRVLVILAAAVPLLVLFVVTDLTFMNVVLCYVGAQVVTLVASAWGVRDLWRGLRWNRKAARRITTYGAQAYVGNISSSLNQRFDQLVVSAFLAVRELGLYTVAATLTSLTSTVGLTVAYVAVPSIAGVPEEQRGRVAERYIGLVVVASILVTIPLVILAPQILTLFFGRNYLPVADVARVLLVGSIAFSVARATEGVLRAVGKPWQASKGELIAVGATMLALAVLLPLFDLMGAAVASLIAYMVSAGWMLWLLSKTFGTPWWRPLLVRRADISAIIGLLQARRRRAA